MICADFLAGANLQGDNPHALFLAVRRLLQMLSPADREQPMGQTKRLGNPSR
jgi:hypothetical protein